MQEGVKIYTKKGEKSEDFNKTGSNERKNEHTLYMYLYAHRCVKIHNKASWRSNVLDILMNLLYSGLPKRKAFKTLWVL